MVGHTGVAAPGRTAVSGLEPPKETRLLSVSHDHTTMTRSRRVRYALYATAITISFFLVLDAAIVWMEHKGWLETTTADDQVSLLAGDPWIQRGDQYVVGGPSVRAMEPASFAVDKGHRWRAFMAGGSFMRGIPYERVGTMRFWLDRALQRHFPAAEVELINAGATSQNSHRVKEIVHFAARHDPDVIIVASCNNEGSLPPTEVAQRLNRSGTYRLIRKMVRSEVLDAERSLHTPQDPDLDTVRAAFRSHLEEMVGSARRAGSRIFLTTLPVNLRYEGNSPGRPTGKDNTREHPGEVNWPACVVEGHAAYEAGEHQRALSLLARCEHIEALRWTGLSHYAIGEYETARRELTQYLEVVPRNRCRPSFQRIIRDVAAAMEVPLIDLEALFVAAAPHGLPGPEHFYSYCHLRWSAQAMAADEMLSTLMQHGAAPEGDPRTPPAENRREVMIRAGGQPDL